VTNRRTVHQRHISSLTLNERRIVEWYVEKILFLPILAWRSNNMQIPLSLIINVSKNLAVRISIWQVIGKNPKNFWQSLMIVAGPVLNHFISERVTVNSVIIIIINIIIITSKLYLSWSIVRSQADILIVRSFFFYRAMLCIAWTVPLQYVRPSVRHTPVLCRDDLTSSRIFHRRVATPF